MSSMKSTTKTTPARRLKVTLALMLATLGLALGGCGTTGPQLDPEGLIPKALTTCEDAPAVPARPADGSARSDTAVAGYIVDLRGAYKDCKGTVAAIAQRRDDLDKQAAKARGGVHFHIPFTKVK